MQGATFSIWKAICEIVFIYTYISRKNAEGNISYKEGQTCNCIHIYLHYYMNIYIHILLDKYLPFKWDSSSESYMCAYWENL